MQQKKVHAHKFRAMNIDEGILINIKAFLWIDDQIIQIQRVVLFPFIEWD